MDPELLELMPHTVTIEPYTGQNTNGEPTFGAAYSYTNEDGQVSTALPCLVDETEETVSFRRLTDPSGQSTNVQSTIYLGVPQKVHLRDRVTLPDGGKRQVQAARRYADPDGYYYAELVV